MNPEQWAQIQEIFLEAADLPAGEVDVFLDRACNGDIDLRRNVEVLLEGDRKSSDSLTDVVSHEAARFSATANQKTPASLIGRRVGPYRIEREIGRGGMGTVYEAIRVDDQYNQRVAIKFIGGGAAGPDALSRFRTERQILATLRHPNIAALLDGGSTDDGHPYLVMEFIDGDVVTDFCRDNELPVTERLDLFCSICDAVHHAHQSLVIHRDIKPANVLVTENGAPKLLDFGIAKLLNTDQGEFAETQTALRRLTPQYASPEQIRGEPLTTATDVYSLGVLLYEMLTFASPYRTTGQSAHDMERAVCESEPARLSTAARDQAGLRRQLSGDLENIVAMALRKEPPRRYGSAQQFADDVRRHRKGLPVSARPDTLLYVVGKLVRRNLLASAVLALLVVSIAVGWSATIREMRRSDARFLEVRRLANSVIFDFQARIQNLPGSTPVREHIVRTALEYLDKLSKDASGDLSLEWELAQAYQQVGDAQGNPAGPNLGHTREALTSYETALTMVKHVAAKRKDEEVLRSLIWLHYKCGDLRGRIASPRTATEDYQRGIELARDLGPAGSDVLQSGHDRMATAQLRAGDVELALDHARLAVETGEAAARQNSRVSPSALARSRRQLGDILWLRGDLQGARNAYEAAVTTFERFFESDPNSLEYREELGDAYRRLGDLLGNPSFFHFDEPVRAAAYHRKAVRIEEELAARDPHDALAQAHLSTAFRRLGAVLRTSQPAEAVMLYRRAVEIMESLSRAAPADLTYRRDLANCRLGYAIALRSAGKPKAALDMLTAVIQAQRELATRFANGSLIKEDMFDALLALGDTQLGLGDPRSSAAAFSEARDTAQFLVKQSAGLYAYRCLALVTRRFGDYHASIARRLPPAAREAELAAADKEYQQAADIWSAWRVRNLAVPYSMNQEKDVAHARALLASLGGGSHKEIVRP